MIISLLEGCLTLLQLGPLRLGRIPHVALPTGGISLLGRFKGIVYKGLCQEIVQVRTEDFCIK
jgi:hypothetical protein